MSIGEQGKELGRLWKEMDAADKKPYLTKAEADKLRYIAEVNKLISIIITL